MRLLQRIGSLLKLAIVCGLLYALVSWGLNESQTDEYYGHAEGGCADAIRHRLDVTSVSVYSVKKKDNGYVVRASAMLSRGKSVKVYCLADRYGGIEDIQVNER